ncbi:hypothetical protein GCM10007167_05580 [Vulcaniibacterium thermophilum]|uniref:Uncharacterized protein n=1 Tax=Vulcaniibacterium thermophilum TaxID=1169913 RepID=A0A919D8E3_9GAMM|nr:hypothetical protein GCM10007167_05580 [Vulcaniibacterium thermophilum]
MARLRRAPPTRSRKPERAVSIPALLASRLPTPDSRLPIPDFRFPTSDSRLPTPDSRFPIPDSRFPIPAPC